MKKFIAAGVGILASASLVFGASPVKASPQDPIVDEQFCTDLSNTIATSLATLNHVTSLLGVANGDLENKRNIMNTEIAEWVTAFGNHLLELDAVDGNTAATQAILDAEAADVTGAVAAWGQAKLAQWTAQHNADLAQVVQAMNTTLQGTVCT
jgi:hypothetical protein